jgi:hypothetical protein
MESARRGAGTTRFVSDAHARLIKQAEIRAVNGDFGAHRSCRSCS